MSNDIEVTPETDGNELAGEIADGLESGQLSVEDADEVIIEAMEDGVAGPTDPDVVERLGRDIDNAGQDEVDAAECDNFGDLDELLGL